MWGEDEGLGHFKAEMLTGQISSRQLLCRNLKLRQDVQKRDIHSGVFLCGRDTIFLYVMRLEKITKVVKGSRKRVRGTRGPAKEQ